MTQQKRHPAGSQCCSLIGGRLTAMSQDWQEKYGTVTQSHSAFLYSPSNHSKAYTRRPSIRFTALLSSQFISQLCSQF